MSVFFCPEQRHEQSERPFVHGDGEARERAKAGVFLRKSWKLCSKTRNCCYTRVSKKAEQMALPFKARGKIESRGTSKARDHFARRADELDNVRCNIESRSTSKNAKRQTVKNLIISKSVENSCFFL